ncbi:hypothetical protein DFQ27_004236 [Actinomortierella ambigua]|uniref:Uncharacterized protein n=1 Tax=Actinomortierella ambigua TaxID=1343610 RepID=A0A9P6Q3K2_9FUNG|nr:hypothetical protein DFQ27_004236 [Actinomortierella ambigua]
MDQSQRPEQQPVASLLFQDVVYFLNPFLDKAEREKARLLSYPSTFIDQFAAHGALRAYKCSFKENETASSRPTHIISRNLDIPDYKQHIARGTHIVTVRGLRERMTSFHVLFTAVVWPPR